MARPPMNRVGETRVMKNGLNATIIEYRNAGDIDVEFEDGVVCRGMWYSSFQKGSIVTYQETTRLGETKVMNNGLRATIIAYRKAVDIDVQFENGVIVEHRTYHSFSNGRINIPAKPRIGERAIMNNGFAATIVAYRSATDMDVQFDGGIVKEHITYNNFCNGSVVCDELVFAARKGETRRMNCGKEATIIAYRGCIDIDVRFEDNTVRRHVRYDSFVEGRVAHVSETREAKAKTRVGETKMMNCGMMATIIAYRTVKDIDVRFEDGTIVHGARYNSFKRRTIANHSNQVQVGVSFQEHAIRYYLQQVGFVKIAKGKWKNRELGLQELDFYHPAANIAIEYDGALHAWENVKERDLRKNKKCADMGIQLYRLRDSRCPSLNGDAIEYVISDEKQIGVGYYDCKSEIEEILTRHSISYDINMIDFRRDEVVIRKSYHQTYINRDARDRIGEIVINKRTGERMTIIAYRSSSDIDVQFEDGTVRNGVAYAGFKSGKVGKFHEAERSQVRIGETRLMKNGMNATIIAYRKSDDIDVQFEDGVIREHVRYQAFCHGAIAHTIQDFSTRVNEIKKMNNGLNATIIAYRGSDDIDVQFEDGIVRVHVTYDSFKRGAISHPYCKAVNARDVNERTGEQLVMKCGSMATIIAYRNFKDIDIQFEDGSIRKHVSYGNFKKREISHPSYTTESVKYANLHVGEKCNMSCEMTARVIAYRNAKDIDIQFEDGFIRQHVAYSNFKKGKVAHNTLNKQIA